MAQTLYIADQAKILNALDTYNYTVPTAGMYVMEIRAYEQPPSGLSIVFNQNGSPKATSVAPTPGQEEVCLRVLVNCAASDVLQAVLSSAVSADSNINSIKAIYSIRAGTV